MSWKHAWWCVWKLIIHTFWSQKIYFIRTHPEELHFLKYISSTHISINISQQRGHQMLTKYYPTSLGCFCDFQKLNLGLQNRIDHPHTMSHGFWWDQHFLCLCLIPQISDKIQEITQMVDLVRSDVISYENVGYGFGTLKGHIFSLWKSQEGPCDVV